MFYFYVFQAFLNFTKLIIPIVTDDSVLRRNNFLAAEIDLGGGQLSVDRRGWTVLTGIQQTVG